MIEIMKYKYCYCYKIIIIIIFINSENLSNKILRSCYFNFVNSLKNKHITSLSQLIIELNKNMEFRNPKYIIFADNIYNKYCSDINAFTIFEYYIHNNLSNALYIINVESDLYKYLYANNKTKNLILFRKKINYTYFFKFLLDTEILVLSYNNNIFIKLINEVSFLKYLYINHGITYFKSDLILPELRNINISKRNIIASSKFEYRILIKKFNYSKEYVHKAGLPRYELYNRIKPNISDKKCILSFFTYRHFNKSIFKKSLYKINIVKLINDKLLIKYLKRRNIELVFVQHHLDLKNKKNYKRHFLRNVKLINHFNITYYITKCSLFITDFSSISFAFMFQNKPALFYLIDFQDKNNTYEKNCFRINDPLQFSNYFLNKNELINKIKYYIDNNFQISKELKRKYESIFYYRHNITKRIYQRINKIIKGNNS